MTCCAEIPIPCLLVSRAVTTWGVSGASRAGDALARAFLPWHRGCEHCGFNIKCVGERTEPLVCLFHPSFLHLCTKLTNPFWKFDDVMPHPLFLKLRPVLHEQTQLCSPHQAKIRHVEGNQRERLICQILSARSFIYYTFTELPGCCGGFSIPGLADVVGGQANTKEFFHGASPLGFHMGLIQPLWSVFCARLCLHEKHQFFTSCRSWKLLDWPQCGYWVLLPQRALPGSLFMSVAAVRNEAVGISTRVCRVCASVFCCWSGGESPEKSNSSQWNFKGA